MSVYKLTCETGKVYYGSTSKTLKHRKSKGWYKCACKDFINPKMELVETVEDLSLLEIVEDKYIRENECVNINRARVTTEDKYHRTKEWREQRKIIETNVAEKIERKFTRVKNITVLYAILLFKHLKN